MRVNRTLLLKIAKETVIERTYSDRSILVAYLTGSLLEEEPLIGKATDIDLVFVHMDTPKVEREIKRLSDQVHLDIMHHDRDLYKQARQLRQHPWLGPTIFRCQILFDPQHFMDFTQASVRSQFDHIENVLERSRQELEQARGAWMNLSMNAEEPNPQSVAKYLGAVKHTANAIASLGGAPLTERRFLLDFPARAEASGQAGLYMGLLGLLGGIDLDKEKIRGWLSTWSAAFNAASGTSHPPIYLHPDRYSYYYEAMATFIDSASPVVALWPMLLTWTDAIVTLLQEQAPFAETHRQHWEKVCQHLGLNGAAFEQRLTALDAYLDTTEELLERWGH
jgi:hypothetical protein